MAVFALPEKIRLEIVTPSGMVVSDTVDEVVLPGAEGEFGVLPGHLPFLTALRIGEMAYRRGGETSYLAVSWGYVEVTAGRVMVLAETAEKAIDIDLGRAQIDKAEAEKLLVATRGDVEDDVAKAQLALALTRVQVASKAGKG
jgi:F-type H+-transporting ATPase subunit epsilon